MDDWHITEQQNARDSVQLTELRADHWYKTGARIRLNQSQSGLILTGGEVADIRINVWNRAKV
jgi:hypothetical protein